jgi:hypothetical protein
MNDAAKLAKGDMAKFYPMGIIECDFASDAGQWETLGYFMKMIKEADPGITFIGSTVDYIDNVLQLQTWSTCMRT